jgi:two-component system cell cycle response regulator DivK
LFGILPAVAYPLPFEKDSGQAGMTSPYLQRGKIILSCRTGWLLLFLKWQASGFFVDIGRAIEIKSDRLPEGTEGKTAMKKIIIADDNKTFLMYLGLLLKRFDFKVMPAENGLEALRLLKLAGADLVILDVHMKVMDGLTALRAIKEDKETAQVPVIMVSCDSDSQMIDKCTELGCYDYLTKPLRIDKLHDSLQKCFFASQGTRRKYLRIPFHGKVVLSHKGADYVLFSETLSEGGIYVIKEDPIPVNSDVEVKWDLGERGEVRAKGNVIYTKKLFGDFLTLPPGMAIKFQELTEEDACSIKFFIEERMAKEAFDSRDNRFFER